MAAVTGALCGGLTKSSTGTDGLPQPRNLQLLGEAEFQGLGVQVEAGSLHSKDHMVLPEPIASTRAGRIHLCQDQPPGDGVQSILRCLL